MRIISDFRDYYDCIYRDYEPNDVIFHRVQSKVDIGKRGRGDFFQCGVEDKYFSFKTFSIVFCGKVYPGVRCGTAKSPFNYDFTYVYSVEDATKFFSERMDDKQWRHYNNTKSRLEICESNIRESMKSAKTYGEKALKLHPKEAIIEVQREHSDILGTVNSRLLNLQFYREMDAYTAAQELHMWLGAQAAPEKEIPKIDDQTMAEAKGFDKFSSFRNTR